MNKTKIEWANYTWSPVTGCLHDCPYCYARRIAERFGLVYAPKLGDPGMEGACKYDGPEGMDTMLELMKPYVDIEGHKSAYPMKFAPTFLRYRLDEPAKMKNPQNIFVCSMADLFGEWVPDEWIHQIFIACEAAPQHRYLFLTKNPARYQIMKALRNLAKGDDYWFGFTATSQRDLDLDSARCGWMYYNTFVSIEPILEPINLKREIRIRWVIVGAETGNRKDRVIPKRKWIENIVEQCRENETPVFMKESLRTLMENDFVQEFPWDKEP